MKKIILTLLIVFTFSCENDMINSFDQDETENLNKQRGQSPPEMDVFSICDFEISATKCNDQDPNLKICLGDSFCFTTSELHTSISGNTNIPGLVDFRNSLYNNVCFRVAIQNQNRCDTTVEILSYNNATGNFNIQTIPLSGFETFEFFYCVPDCQLII